MNVDQISGTVQAPLPPYAVPPTVVEVLDAAERDALRAEIKSLLARENAVLVAHYYTDPELQSLAEETGGYVSDSLDMARFGHEHAAHTLVVAGVRFMGETAKILNPEKRVLMPELKAECSLDLGCPADAFTAFCDQHPDRTVVVYDDDRNMTAARAWWVLRWAGLPDVRVLDGGLPAWLAAGMPVAHAPGRPAPSMIELSPGHMPELDAGACATLARNGVLLDARIRPNYIGGRSAPGQPARGHIPGALSVPAHDNFTDPGPITDNETLAALYRGLGADGSTAVGVYCGAGMSAAVTVLALAAIGIEAAMYVGSWSAWVGDPGRAVATGAHPG